MIDFRLYFPAAIGIGLLLGEGLLVSLLVDAQHFPHAGVMSHMGDVLRWLVISATLFSILLFSLHRQEFRRLFKAKFAHWQYWLIHIFLFALFVAVTYGLFTTVIIGNHWLLLWFLLAGASILTWFTLLYKLPYLYELFLTHRYLFLMALASGALLIFTVSLVHDIWKPLSAITLHSSKSLLAILFHHHVFVDAEEKLLGLHEFVVHIAPACSGLEGLVTSLITTGIYIIAIRQQLKFPLALLLLPIAAVLSIIFNIFRITVLLIIGAYVSPELAVEGFHSVAGWISAIIIACLVIFVFSNINFFFKMPEKKVSATLDHEASLAWAVLIPFVLILAVTLINGIFHSEFDFFYPIKVIIGGAALIYYWRVYQLQKPQQNLLAISSGLVVAALWVLLVPNDEEYNAIFMASFESMNSYAQIGWGIFRLLGFIIIAPIVEELVFRGYLLARLGDAPLELNKSPSFSIIALVISTAVFGFIHGAWVAGMMAGFIFAMVRYRGSNISDAILCHGVANLAVVSWALLTQQWGLL